MARRLPIAPIAKPSRVRLPLAEAVRPRDAIRPSYAVWELTLACDLACRHCGSRAGRARPDELTTAEALDLARQLIDLGIDECTVIGGEAYLREDWLDIVRVLVQGGVRTTMTTGGRGITAARAGAMRDAGLDSVSVSIDGLEATHDHLRAVVGSWASALAALDHLRAVEMPVSVNTQIGSLSVREIEPLLDELAQRQIFAWQMQLTVAMGRAADEPELLLQPYQMLEVMPMLSRVWERGRELGVRLWPGNNIGYFGPYEHKLRFDAPDKHHDSCGAGRSSIGIEANGDIKGCPSLPTSDYVGGNVRTHRLRDIWERSAALRFGRDRTVDELWGHCGTCYYADHCRAGCTWTGHTLLGRRGNNPYCHHRALTLLDAGRRERVELEVSAPGEPFDFGRYRLVEEDWPPDALARARAVVDSGRGWL
jgi:radical SAM protein with 4Fe4S-binding SPASM domain